jgi:hypothetical protein
MALSQLLSQEPLLSLAIWGIAAEEAKVWPITRIMAGTYDGKVSQTIRNFRMLVRRVCSGPCTGDQMLGTSDWAAQDHQAADCGSGFGDLRISVRAAAGDGLPRVTGGPFELSCRYRTPAGCARPYGFRTSPQPAEAVHGLHYCRPGPDRYSAVNVAAVTGSR